MGKIALGPQKVTAPERRSPGPRGAGVVGWPLHSPPLTVLGPGAGPWHLLCRRSAHNQNGCLPGGASGRTAHLAWTCWRCPHPGLYRVRHFTAEPARPPLLPWSPLYRQAVVPLCLHPGEPGAGDEGTLLPVPPPAQAPTFHESAGLGRALPFCTHVLVSLGASTGFTRADLGSIPGRLARGRFGLSVGFQKDIL